VACPKPVIGAVHAACVGGGVDLLTATDVRLCTRDAWFQAGFCFPVHDLTSRRKPRFEFEDHFIFLLFCKSGMFIPDPDFYTSWISDPGSNNNNKRGIKNLLSCYGHKFQKIKNYLIFDKYRKNFVPIDK
jgi:hypothetical protein